MKHFVKFLINKLNFKIDIENDILDKLNIAFKHNKKEIILLINQYKDTSFDFLKKLDIFREILSKTQLNQYEIDLLYVLLLSKNLRKIYRNNGLSDDLFFNTLEDIKFKVDECILVKKVVGTFVVSWYRAFFDLTLFSFGRLQYQICEFSLDYEDIKANDLSLNIHIPRNGQRLEPKLIDESLEQATNFFKDKFKKEDLIFRCYSWLLNPYNKTFLNKNSNIVKFSERFKIVKTVYENDYKELWRIFDSEYKNVEDLKDTSSLTHGYIEMVKNGVKFGESFGYFKINN